MEKLKLILLGSVLAFSNAIYAQKGDCEPLIVQRGAIHNSNGPRYEVPVVTYDDDDVTITSDSTITDMTVVIRDQYGNVMHQSTQTVGPAETTLYVPNTDGDSEKTTIDLYYDRRHLSGTFEE